MILNVKGVLILEMGLPSGPGDDLGKLEDFGNVELKHLMRVIVFN